MWYSCRMCRFFLFSTSNVNESHSQTSTCSSYYMDIESMPEWIVNALEETGWTKGKLLCPRCTRRVGSFNIVTSTACACGNATQPTIQVSKRKVDEREQKYHQTQTPPSHQTGKNSNGVVQIQKEEEKEEEATSRQDSSNRSDSEEEESQLSRNPSNNTSNSHSIDNYSDADTDVEVKRHDDESDFCCPVCLDLLCKPSRLNCAHVFCEPCVKELKIRFGTGIIHCPLCRTTVETIQTDKALETEIIARFPDKYKIILEKYRQKHYRYDRVFLRNASLNLRQGVRGINRLVRRRMAVRRRESPSYLERRFAELLMRTSPRTILLICIILASIPAVNLLHALCRASIG